MPEITVPDRIREQSAWYGTKARWNRSTYVAFKIVQTVVAAAIPVVSVAVAGDVQRWMSAILGALIGIIEAVLQLGQYQRNWLTYRATREAVGREDFLHSAKAGPYTDQTNLTGSMWSGLTQSYREKVRNGSYRTNNRLSRRKRNFFEHSVLLGAETWIEHIEHYLAGPGTHGVPQDPGRPRLSSILQE
jgi:hypothetical protein